MQTICEHHAHKNQAEHLSQPNTKRMTFRRQIAIVPNGFKSIYRRPIQKASSENPRTLSYNQTIQNLVHSSLLLFLSLARALIARLLAIDLLVTLIIHSISTQTNSSLNSISFHVPPGEQILAYLLWQARRSIIPLRPQLSRLKIYKQLNSLHTS